jgi:hypothetical protein
MRPEALKPFIANPLKGILPGSSRKKDLKNVAFCLIFFPRSPLIEKISAEIAQFSTPQRIMKRLLYCTCGLLLATVHAPAPPLFSDDFNSYANGNLVGQGPWLQTGTIATSPIQVSSSQVVLGTSGQDAYAAFPGGAITLTDGTTIYEGLTVNLSAAQATGDYITHFTPTAGNTVTFISRLFAKSSGAGYVIGWVETSGGAVPAYGSTVLSFGTSYRVVVAYNDVAGALNDSGVVYVNPTDVLVEANNTPYVSKSWTSTTAESEAFAAVNLRQGTAANAPSVTLDDLNVSQTFSEVATFTPVPEPQGLALLGGFGMLAWNVFRRRK